MTFGLLRLTGGLFAAYWPVLFFWFLVQHVTHGPLLDASVQLGLFNRPLGFLGLALLVVVQLLCTIAMWLAIAAIIYGHDVREPGDLAESHARVTRLHARYARLPRLLQWIAETWSDGWRKKALPVVNSLRLLLRAGLRPALTLCVCYVALHFACSWAFRGAVWMIGPHDRDMWNVILGPLSLLVGDISGQNRSLIQEPLRICLLAAAVDVTLRTSRSDVTSEL